MQKGQEDNDMGVHWISDLLKPSALPSAHIKRGVSWAIEIWLSDERGKFIFLYLQPHSIWRVAKYTEPIKVPWTLSIPHKSEVPKLTLN